jgi:hypothetical protein
MNITTDCDRCGKIEKCAFLEKNVLGHAEKTDKTAFVKRLVGTDSGNETIKIHDEVIKKLGNDRGVKWNLAEKGSSGLSPLNGGPENEI